MSVYQNQIVWHYVFFVIMLNRSTNYTFIANYNLIKILIAQNYQILADFGRVRSINHTDWAILHEQHEYLPLFFNFSSLPNWFYQSYTIFIWYYQIRAWFELFIRLRKLYRYNKLASSMIDWCKRNISTRESYCSSVSVSSVRL